jgi:hypothetical protein
MFFQYYGFNAMEVQNMGEKQPGWAGTNYANLSLHYSGFLLIVLRGYPGIAAELTVLLL